MNETPISRERASVAINKNQSLILSFLSIFCIFALLAAILNGSYPISLLSILKGGEDSIQKTIIIDIRLPRVLLSCFVGASLGICGAVLQGLFRNPLADPGLIGVSAGAALGAAIAIVILPPGLSGSLTGQLLLPISGILGAFIVIMLLFSVTKGFGGHSTTYLLLMGVAINAIVGVLIGVLTYISTNTELRTLTFWTMGSFSGATWTLLLPASVAIMSSIGLLIPTAKNLNLIQLGEIEAYRLGVNVQKLKTRIIVCCAICIGVSVALSGIIGFIGLVVPHIARLLGGVSHKYLLPSASLLGAGIMISADLISRIIIEPMELPVGLITSAIGSPFFLWLIFRMRKHDY